jgi:hypothetical protein
MSAPLTFDEAVAVEVRRRMAVVEKALEETTAREKALLRERQSLMKQVSDLNVQVLYLEGQCRVLDAQVAEQINTVLDLELSLQHTQSSVIRLMQPVPSALHPRLSASVSQTRPTSPSSPAVFCESYPGKKVFPSLDACSQFWYYQREITSIDSQKGLPPTARDVSDGCGGEYKWKYFSRQKLMVRLQSWVMSLISGGAKASGRTMRQARAWTDRPHDHRASLVGKGFFST